MNKIDMFWIFIYPAIIILPSGLAYTFVAINRSFKADLIIYSMLAVLYLFIVLGSIVNLLRDNRKLHD